MNSVLRANQDGFRARATEHDVAASLLPSVVTDVAVVLLGCRLTVEVLPLDDDCQCIMLLCLLDVRVVREQDTDTVGNLVACVRERVQMKLPRRPQVAETTTPILDPLLHLRDVRVEHADVVGGETADSEVLLELLHFAIGDGGNAIVRSGHFD